MTLQYRALPTYTEPVDDKGNMSAAWRRWFSATDTGTPPAAEASITVGASPFTYQATQKGFVIVTGGTVSSIQFTRTGTYSTGQTAGVFPVSLADILTVTWSGKPTMTFVPQ
jgi:hypothetical protein